MVATLATKIKFLQKNTANAIFALGCYVIPAAFHYVFQLAQLIVISKLWVDVDQLQEL